MHLFVCFPIVQRWCRSLRPCRLQGHCELVCMRRIFWPVFTSRVYIMNDMGRFSPVHCFVFYSGSFANREAISAVSR